LKKIYLLFNLQQIKILMMTLIFVLKFYLLEIVMKNKILSWVYIVPVLMSWLCCIVVFGGELHKTKAQGATAQYFWQEAHYDLGGSTITIKYIDNPSDPIAYHCVDGGRATLAFMILAFFTLTAAVPLGILRAIGKEYWVPRLGSNLSLYLIVEVGLVIASTVKFLLSASLWGGTCFKWTKNEAPVDADVSATGFAYLCVCLSFLAVDLLLLFYLRAERLALGSDTTTTPGPQYAPIDPRATSPAPPASSPSNPTTVAVVVDSNPPTTSTPSSAATSSATSSTTAASVPVSTTPANAYGTF